MFKFKKHNKKSRGKTLLHTSANTYSPFDYTDTKYLEHLHNELKLKQSRESSIALRKHIIEGNQRANYQNELDRLNMEIQRDNLPHNTKEHLEARIKQLKYQIFT